MKKPAVYILDSDVFITAKNTYYAFDFCPGFWSAILQEHHKGRVFSVSRVRGELMSGTKTEDLVEWVGGEVPESFFLDVDTEPVTTAYREVMRRPSPPMRSPPRKRLRRSSSRTCATSSRCP